MADELTGNIAVVDPALTSALGLFENQPTPSILPIIAPDVRVTNAKFKARVWSKDQLRRVGNVTRPRGGSAERVTKTWADPKNMAVEEKALRDVLDRRDIDEALNSPAGPFDLRLETARMIRNNLLTTIEANAADLFLDSANYGSDNKDAISTAFSGTTTLKEIRDAQYAIIRAQAVRPGTLILTPEAWAEVQDNSTIRDQLKYTNSQTLTEEMVAKYFQLDQVLVPLSVTWADDESGSFIWAGKKALLLFIDPNPGLNGRCFAKTFFREVYGTREYAKTGFDMDGNEHIIITREEETYIIFSESAFLWY